jgi:hypothetical protein
MRLSPGHVIYSWPSGKVNFAEKIINFSRRVKIWLASLVTKFHSLINDNKILLVTKI